MKPADWILAGAILAGAAVALGAFGAHGLGGRLASGSLAPADAARRLEIFETAARYQMYHALAMVLVGLAAAQGPTTCLTIAGWCFIAGTLLFSGSLYALVLSGITKLGAITPFGGALFIAGWVALAVAAARR